MSRPLEVLVTADPELPVPPRLYGGIERIIALLVAGLSRRGHHVTLVAHRDSAVDCAHVPYAAMRSDSTLDTARNSALVLRETLRRKPDVVQAFSRLAYLTPLLPLPVPKVMSYQRAVTPRSIRWSTRASRGTLHFTGCSRQLIRDVASIGDWRVIHNAVPIDRYDFVPEAAADAPLVFLGRIETIKGAHVAIEVARASGRRLVIAGNVDPAHRAYFTSQIEPHLDGHAVQYLGPVDDGEKNGLLGGAAALLMPILWEEPFGIVMAEALACGTPVLGFPRGAVPEVIDHGRTGFVCADAADMAAHVGRIGDLSRAACREAAERRFSDTALVDAYEALYRDVA
jgi:glycosyltransferase involved in cell wall biosynthesis